MTERRWGMHIHHDRLFELISGSLEERIEYIKSAKPPDEQPLRLRLIQEVPAERIPLRLREARALYERARVVCWSALEVYAKGRMAIPPRVMDYSKTYSAFDKAWDAYRKVLADCTPELEALHREICVPDCPWNGTTIFPEMAQ